MISINDFCKWLSEDITISTDAQKLIIKKLSEYIQLKSKDGKVIKPKKIDLIS